MNLLFCDYDIDYRHQQQLPTQPFSEDKDFDQEHPQPRTLHFPINKYFNSPFFKYPPKKMTCLPHQDHYIVNRQLKLESKQFIYNFTNDTKIHGHEDKSIPNLPPSFKLMPPLYQLPKEEQLSQTSLIPHGISLFSSNIQGLMNQKLLERKPIELNSVEKYKNLIVLQNEPKIIERYSSTEQLNRFEWLNDEEFGRQRLQGINSGQLCKINRSLWKEREYDRIFDMSKSKTELDLVTRHYTGFSFNELLEFEHLFVVDYSIFNDQEYFEDAIKFGRYVSSPVALFFIDEHRGGKLYPLAIKILQNDPESPIFTPKSNEWEWLFAKIWFQSADGQHMEFITHLFECHLLGEVFCIATHRTLSDLHPIYQLLHPHFNLLLDINWRARGHLLGKDGPIDTLLGGGSVGALTFIGKFNTTYQWYQHTFLNRLKRNNIIDEDYDVSQPILGNGAATTTSNSSSPTSPLSNYHFLDDGLRVYSTIYHLVNNILSSFYQTEKDIEMDFELHSWIKELTSEYGGQIKGLFNPTQVFSIGNNDPNYKLKDIVELVADIMFRLTVEHSIGNHGQWDMYGFTPNVPGALYMDPRKIRRGPSGSTDISLETIINALPPLHQSLSQITITHLLANTDTGLPSLADVTYQFERLNNSKINHAISSFRTNLQSISNDIEFRNSTVFTPYSYIDPKKVCSSIFI